MARYRIRKIPGGWLSVQRFAWVVPPLWWRWENSGLCFRCRRAAKRYMERSKKLELVYQREKKWLDITSKIERSKGT